MFMKRLQYSRLSWNQSQEREKDEGWEGRGRGLSFSEMTSRFERLSVLLLADIRGGKVRLLARDEERLRSGGFE